MQPLVKPLGTGAMLVKPNGSGSVLAKPLANTIKGS